MIAKEQLLEAKEELKVLRQEGPIQTSSHWLNVFKRHIEKLHGPIDFSQPFNNILFECFKDEPPSDNADTFLVCNSLVYGGINDALEIFVAGRRWLDDFVESCNMILLKVTLPIGNEIETKLNDYATVRAMELDHTPITWDTIVITEKMPRYVISGNCLVVGGQIDSNSPYDSVDITDSFSKHSYREIIDLVEKTIQFMDDIVSYVDNVISIRLYALTLKP